MLNDKREPHSASMKKVVSARDALVDARGVMNNKSRTLTLFDLLSTREVLKDQVPVYLVIIKQNHILNKTPYNLLFHEGRFQSLFGFFSILQIWVSNHVRGNYVNSKRQNSFKGNCSVIACCLQILT